MSLVGIIDLGSNSVRLVVYSVDAGFASASSSSSPSSDSKARSKHPSGAKKPFSTLMDKKKIAGLSAYVVDGRLTEEGIETAIDAVSSLARSANNIGCDDVRLFATAVIRNCSNSKEAAEAISNAVGIKADVLSAIEEAHLGFVGASFGNPIDDGTLIDIGGGSTELTSIRSGKDTRYLSIPQGCVSSYARCVSLILPQPEEEKTIKSTFLKNLSKLGDIDDFSSKRVYGIGGSVRAIEKLYAVAFADGKRCSTISAEQMEELQSLLATNPSAFAHAATKAVPERMHTVTPGLIIVRMLLEELGASSLTVCKYGIREGYMLEKVLGA